MRDRALILLTLLCLWPVSLSAEEISPASEVSTLADRWLLLDVAKAGERLVAVGDRGHVLLRDDAKSGWRQVIVPSRVLLTAVHFLNARSGWAVGHDATILKTQDGGESWQSVYFDPQEDRPLLDIWFADEKHGYAIGAYGLFMESRDGGDSWQIRPSFYGEDDFHLNALRPAGDGSLFIAAEAGNIYRSTDMGKSWQSLPSPYYGSFYGVLPLADKTLLIYGMRGHLYRSEDGGDTWKQTETGLSTSLTHAMQLSDGRILLTGQRGSLLISDDQGRSVTVLKSAGRHDLASAVETADGLLLFGDTGVRRYRIEAR